MVTACSFPPEQFLDLKAFLALIQRTDSTIPLRMTMHQRCSRSQPLPPVASVQPALRKKTAYIYIYAESAI